MPTLCDCGPEVGAGKGPSRCATAGEYTTVKRCCPPCDSTTGLGIPEGTDGSLPVGPA